MALNFVQRRFFSTSLKQIAYNLSGFNKYGLWRDDLITETEEVQEALKRIPEKIVDERNYRILRAMQLTIQNDILPKEQWTKMEDDKLYLTPVLEQLKKEKDEVAEWNKNH